MWHDIILNQYVITYHRWKSISVRNLNNWHRRSFYYFHLGRLSENEKWRSLWSGMYYLLVNKQLSLKGKKSPREQQKQRKENVKQTRNGEPRKNKNLWLHFYLFSICFWWLSWLPALADVANTAAVKIVHCTFTLFRIWRVQSRDIWYHSDYGTRTGSKLIFKKLTCSAGRTNQWPPTGPADVQVALEYNEVRLINHA